MRFTCWNTCRSISRMPVERVIDYVCMYIHIYKFANADPSLFALSATIINNPRRKGGDIICMESMNCYFTCSWSLQRFWILNIRISRRIVRNLWNQLMWGDLDVSHSASISIQYLSIFLSILLSYEIIMILYWSSRNSVTAKIEIQNSYIIWRSIMISG